MATDRKIYLTNLGKELIAEAAKGGYEFQVLKIVLGNGLTHAGKEPEEIEKVTSLESAKLSLTDISIEIQSPDLILARGKVDTAATIEESFRASETGVIARLKKTSDGTYYPSAEGILHEYRNVGEEGDWIPAKESGEAWSLSYCIATVVSNVSSITPVIRGDITREEFEAHVNNVSPHKNFMITGEETEDIAYVNVNYAGSGNEIDFISFDKFKEQLDIVNMHTYIEKDKVKRIIGDKSIDEHIPDEVISNTTEDDIDRHYLIGKLSGFTSVEKEELEEGIWLLTFKLNDISSAETFTEDLVSGQEIFMNFGTTSELKVNYVGLNEDSIVVKSTREISEPNVVLSLTSAIVIPGKVYPSKMYEQNSMEITTPGLNWNKIAPESGTTEKTDQFYVDSKMSIAGNLSVSDNTFTTTDLDNDYYFNAWDFNETTNNLIETGLIIPAVGSLNYVDGLFDKKAIQPSNESYLKYTATDAISNSTFLVKLLNKSPVSFTSWIKLLSDDTRYQVIYDENLVCSKTFKETYTLDNVWAYWNFKDSNLTSVHNADGAVDLTFSGSPTFEDTFLSGSAWEGYKAEKGLLKIQKNARNFIPEGKFTMEVICEKTTGSLRFFESFTHDDDGNSPLALVVPDPSGVPAGNPWIDVRSVTCPYPMSEALSSEGLFLKNTTFDFECYATESEAEQTGICYYLVEGTRDGLTMTMDKVLYKLPTDTEFHSAIGGDPHTGTIEIAEGSKFYNDTVQSFQINSDVDLIQEYRIMKGTIDEEDRLSYDAPFKYVAEEEHTEKYELPVFKVILENGHLKLIKFDSYTGSGKDRKANYTIFSTPIGYIKDWEHVTITCEDASEVYLDGTKVSWSSSEQKQVDFPENDDDTKAIHFMHNIFIGGDDEENYFDGYIQDVGHLNKKINPILPLLPIMSTEIRGMGYAYTPDQAIPFFKVATEGITETFKMISGTTNGNFHVLFGVSGATSLFKLTLNSSNKIDFEEIQAANWVDELYTLSNLIKEKGNNSLTSFIGKEFANITPAEDLLLYPFFVLDGQSSTMSNLEIDRTTKTSIPVYTFEDVKYEQFSEPLKIEYIKATVDESSAYDSMTIKYEGYSSEGTWEEINNDSRYTKLRATLNVDFSSTHKEDGKLMISDVSYIGKTNTDITTGYNSELVLKPINTEKTNAHSFIKYTNFDNLPNNAYQFVLENIQRTQVVETFDYQAGNTYTLSNLLVDKDITIIVTNSKGNYVSTLSSKEFTVKYSSKVIISLNTTLTSGYKLKIVYFVCEPKETVYLNAKDHTNLNKELIAQHSIGKFENNVVVPKIEIITNDCLDYVINNVPSAKTFVVKVSRTVRNVKVLLDSTEVAITANTGGGYLIINAPDLETGQTVSIQFEYVASKIIDGFSDFGIILA